MMRIAVNGMKIIKKISISISIVFILAGTQATLASASDFSVGDNAFVCNARSDVTHLRAGPSAKNRSITGYLPNSLPVTIQQLKTNTAGFTIPLQFK